MKSCEPVYKFYKVTGEHTARCDMHGWSVASKTEKDCKAQSDFHKGVRK